MKKLYLNEMLLVSPREKKAKRVNFDRDINIILGKNDTGKSCLLKSIYDAFGAKPPTIHPVWKNAQVISLIDFTIDKENYVILKHANSYSIFDKKKELIKSFYSVTRELGPYLGNLFNFGILLNTRDGEPITPPPAYFFLPFYIDQDNGWNKNWASFGPLKQIPDWKKPLIEYHLGIYPNEYYRNKSDLESFKRTYAESEKEIEIIKRVSRKVEEHSRVDFDLDIDSFKREIEDLLVECQKLKQIEDKLKARLVELNNQKIHIGKQIQIVKEAEKEFALDYKYATETLKNEHVECPTCGAEYENSFAERFSLAKEENNCYEFIAELQDRLDDINDKIAKENKKYQSSETDLKHIESLLEIKKSEVRLKDLIESEGKKEIRRELKDEVSTAYKKLGADKMKIDELKEYLASFNDKKRRQEINRSYLQNMENYLKVLSVKEIVKDSYKSITSSIVETGSDLPRSLVAYNFSILHTIHTYSPATFAPIVIDSPNQQGQDLVNLKNVIQFIIDNKPKDAQLILGLENLCDVTFEGKLIELKNERSLLQEEDYEDVWSEVDGYIKQTL